AAEIVSSAVIREMPLMRAPTEFRWLRALAVEAVDRPGVDEFAGRLGYRRDLRVALGDVDRLDPETLREPAPAGAVHRRGDPRIGRARDIEERLLDEVRHEPGIGAMCDNRGRAGARAALLRPQGERAFAQGIIRAGRRR